MRVIPQLAFKLLATRTCVEDLALFRKLFKIENQSTEDLILILEWKKSKNVQQRTVRKFCWWGKSRVENFLPNRGYRVCVNIVTDKFLQCVWDILHIEDSIVQKFATRCCNRLKNFRNHEMTHKLFCVATANKCNITACAIWYTHQWII